MSVIKRWDNFTLVRDRSGMQLINQSMQHSDKPPYGHTHNLQSISYAKRLVNAVKRNCVPRARGIEFLKDMVRLVPDRSLRQEIKELIKVRKNKTKQHYDNKPVGHH